MTIEELIIVSGMMAFMTGTVLVFARMVLQAEKKEQKETA